MIEGKVIPRWKTNLKSRWYGFRNYCQHLVFVLLSFLFVGKVCWRCNSMKDVRLESSRTACAWDGVGEDPNADVPLCRPCAEEHHYWWDAQWDEYNASRG